MSEEKTEKTKKTTTKTATKKPTAKKPTAKKPTATKEAITEVVAKEVVADAVEKIVQHTPLENEAMPPCFCCKKVWKRHQTDGYVYHDSKGIVCRNHHGVMNWYNELIEAMQKELKAKGVVPF